MFHLTFSGPANGRKKSAPRRPRRATKTASEPRDFREKQKKVPPFRCKTALTLLSSAYFCKNRVKKTSDLEVKSTFFSTKSTFDEPFQGLVDRQNPPADSANSASIFQLDLDPERA